MKKISFLILPLILFSCSYTRNIPVKFEREDKESIEAFLNNKNINYDIQELATLNHINTFIDFNSEGKLVVPEAYFFNKSGYRVKDDFNGTRCSLVISNIDQVNSATANSEEKIDDWLKDIKLLHEHKGSSKIFDEDYDLYVIINWSIYADKILKGHATETSFLWYNDLKKNNRGLNIKIILLNLDIQKDWEMTEAQNEVLGL